MTIEGVASAADLVARSLALAGAGLAGLVAATHWAVRRRRLNAFGAWPRVVRQLSDPFLKPVERAVVRRGGNPQDGTLWLLGITVLAGLLLVTLVRWAFGMIGSVAALADASPRVWVRAGVSWAFGILSAAIVIRVVGTWFGASPYARWMRPLVVMTEWLIAPIRRIVPPFGPIDVSPILAYFALLLVRGLVLAAL